ncbi:PH domain [Carpediemonas membranifera]|uniref:PH domain n=1 Tax=Carpediemonas membranifera TaxID=201153 RepID=A0A8J6AZ98_9EUKA|nr:PH domain [Carpediemonas membranifera]|eukprot:KAG9395975.1 PH domain [Carpediemonas membranifera]
MPRGDDSAYDVIISGPLFKTSDNGMKNWKKRHCILFSDGVLKYYAAEGDTKPKGVVGIQKAEIVVSNADEVSKDFCFQVNTGGRLFFFAADTEDEMQGWLETLIDLQTALGDEAGAVMNPMFSAPDVAVDLGQGKTDEDQDDAVDAKDSSAASKTAKFAAGVSARTKQLEREQASLPRDIGRTLTQTRYHTLFNLPREDLLIFVTRAHVSITHVGVDVEGVDESLGTGGQLMVGLHHVAFDSKAGARGMVNFNQMTELIRYDRVNKVELEGTLHHTVTLALADRRVKISKISTKDRMVCCMIEDRVAIAQGRRPPSIATDTPTKAAMARPSRSSWCRMLSSRVTGGKGWKERYVVLYRDVLVWYKSFSQWTPTSVVRLQDCMAERVDEMVGKPKCVGIFFYKQRCVIIRLKSDAEADRWVVSINQNRAPLSDPSLAEALESYVRAPSLHTVFASTLLFASFEVELGDAVVEAFTAHLKVNPTAGTLFLTRRNVYFVSNKILGGKLKDPIPFDAIRDIRTRPVIGGLEIVTADHKYFFSRVDGVSRCLTILYDLVAIAVGEEPPSVTAGSPTTTSIAECERCGWMRKCGPKGRYWNRRYCILYGGILWYYRSPAGLVPFGSVVLEKCIAVPADRMIGHPNALAIIFSRTRTFFFKVASAQLRDEWVDAINGAIPKGSINPTLQATLQELAACQDKRRVRETGELIRALNLNEDIVIISCRAMLAIPPCPGRLFITRNNVCFVGQTPIIQSNTREVIPFTDIVSVSSKLNGLVVQGTKSSQTFTLLPPATPDPFVRLCTDLTALHHGKVPPTVTKGTPPAAVLVNATAYGYLDKFPRTSANFELKARAGELWKRRWVSLDGTTLYYYKDTAGLVPKGSVDLSKYSCIVHTAHRVLGIDNTFAIFFATEMPFFFRASDSRVMRYWIDKLSAACPELPMADRRDLEKQATQSSLDQMISEDRMNQMFVLPSNDRLVDTADCALFKPSIGVPIQGKIIVTSSSLCFYSHIPLFSSAKVQIALKDIEDIRPQQIMGVSPGLRVRTREGQYRFMQMIQRQRILKFLRDTVAAAAGREPPSLRTAKPTTFACVSRGVLTGYLDAMVPSSQGEQFLQRWCAIVDGRMMMFKDNTSTEPLRIIPLEACVAVAGKKITGKDRSFAILSLQGANIAFKTAHEDVAAAWVEKINSNLRIALNEEDSAHLKEMSLTADATTLFKLNDVFERFELESGQVIVSQYPCTLVRTMSVTGRLIMTQSYVLFTASSLFSSSKLQIPFRYIQDIRADSNHAIAIEYRKPKQGVIDPYKTGGEQYARDVDSDSSSDSDSDSDSESESESESEASSGVSDSDDEEEREENFIENTEPTTVTLSGFGSRDAVFDEISDAWAIMKGDLPPSLLRGAPTKASLRDADMEGNIDVLNRPMTAWDQHQVIVKYRSIIIMAKSVGDAGGKKQPPVLRMMSLRVCRLMDGSTLTATRCTLGVFSIQKPSSPVFLRFRDEEELADWRMIIEEQIGTVTPEDDARLKAATEQAMVGGDATEFLKANELPDDTVVLHTQRAVWSPKHGLPLPGMLLLTETHWGFYGKVMSREETAAHQWENTEAVTGKAVLPSTVTNALVFQLRPKSEWLDDPRVTELKPADTQEKEDVRKPDVNGLTVGEISDTDSDSDSGDESDGTDMVGYIDNEITESGWGKARSVLKAASVLGALGSTHLADQIEVTISGLPAARQAQILSADLLALGAGVTPPSSAAQLPSAVIHREYLKRGHVMGAVISDRVEEPVIPPSQWHRSYMVVAGSFLYVYSAPDDSAPGDIVNLADCLEVTLTSATLAKVQVAEGSDSESEDEAAYASDDGDSDSEGGSVMRRSCVIITRPDAKERLLVLGSDDADEVQAWFDVLEGVWDSYKPKLKKLGVMSHEDSDGRTVDEALPTRHQVVPLRSLQVSLGGLFGKGTLSLMKSLDTQSIIVRLTLKRKKEHRFYAHEMLDIDMDEDAVSGRVVISYQRPDAPKPVRLRMSSADIQGTRDVHRILSEAMWMSQD